MKTFHLIKTACLSLSLFLISCGVNDNKTTVRIAGSTTVLPPISIASERFYQAQPKIQVIVNAGGSGVGINQVGLGKIDIGMASRDMSDKEKSTFEDRNLISLAIGYDAVAVAVSSEVYESGIRALSLEQIRSIYAGEISNWSALGGPDREILVLDKEASRGTRHVFMEKVFGDENAKALGADLILGSNNEEQTAISQSDAAIGMLSHAWLNEQVRGLSIQMGKDTIPVSLERIVAGDYPIVRALNLVYSTPLKPEAKAFIDFVLSPQGQSIVKEQGYVAVAP